MQDLAKAVSDTLKKSSRMLVTAESCTGGLVASTLTRIAGSSEIFERGFVTYSNEAKQELLNVKAQTLEEYGAVSEETAKEMAEGALLNSHADIAVSVTGVAGPGGGSDNKPVGMVCFGISDKNGYIDTLTQHFTGSRADIQDHAAKYALSNVLKTLERYS